MKLRVASPEDILRWSHGEVTKPETINYRTQRPEKDGLFSERIFGPTKDWECYCGKYRRVRYKNVVCDKCGVEVTRSIVRRERMGHIALATPVAHIWFFRNVPSKLGLLLDVPMQKLEKVIYYAAYIITQVDEEAREMSLKEIEKEYKQRKKAKTEEVSDAVLKSGVLAAKAELNMLRVGEVLTEAEYVNLAKRFGGVFKAGSGAEAIRKILEAMDLKKEVSAIRKDLKGIEDSTAEVRLLKRLKLLTSLEKEGIRPEWMILTVLPILPPDLRPMVALDGGRYATSDLNDLYRRVINRNNRLKKLMELNAPDVIVTNEKRMLQEAVDALVDNSARFGAQQMSAQRRPLRSLADMLKGKQGRFRQNLLGKRVDYSGRSVIVIGPELQLHQCGLPKKMALEMFKPFVINKIIERGLAHNIRNANRLIEAAPPEVWEILEEVSSNKKVLLNRAPTLHRLGVQAFQPLLIEDLVIRIPPMVCTAFNADFDGDQMAVHLPLTEEAQREASEIMLSSVNLLKPATGDPIMVPTQDIVLGCFSLTRNPSNPEVKRTFSSVNEAFLAYENGIVMLHDMIRVPHPKKAKEWIETTVGRLRFNEHMPKDFDFVNRQLDKKELSKVVGAIIATYGAERSGEYLDNIKRIGFAAATDSGISWGMDDMTVPTEKKELLKEAEAQEAVIWEQYNNGLLTESERKSRIISIWDKVKSKLAKLLPQVLGVTNPIFAIISSGARGSWSQPTQMMGMKGLVANPKGETMELPVKSSLKEGFSVLEYFISTHGARKGTTDTALKTASAGYLTRRLVDVSQDLVIREEDCRSKEGIEMRRKDGADFGHSFAARLFSRTALADVKAGNKVLVRAGEVIDRATAEAIEATTTVESVWVRSPITCKTLYGLCSACYGFNLGNNRLVEKGEAVGIVAAQSIGEPGTQLTMRTFHIGGVAGADITHGLPRVEELFEARPPKGKAFMSEIDGVVESIEEKGLIRVVRIRGTEKKDGIVEYPIPRTSEIYFKVNDMVKKGDQLSEGHLDIKELLALRGKEEVQRYIVGEVQRIYVSEGASINNKHIEIIVRQMFSRVKIKEAGDTEFVPGDIVEKSRFLEVNREMKRSGKTPARAKQLLMSVTKVALSTESFLSSASFQETARVLINAATEGKVDVLRGLKENVIIGRLIPVGTGFKFHEERRKLRGETIVEEAGEESVE